MRIQIAVPVSSVGVTGNRHTAQAWSQILQDLGHEVLTTPSSGPLHPDVTLLALHALKTRDLILEHHQRFPHQIRLVALTGTDLYQGDPHLLQAPLEAATLLITLQHRAPLRLPAPFQHKTHVIPQSFVPPPPERIPPPSSRSIDPFNVCVIGHLRAVKDPLRAAAAARLLPPSSRIHILHAGDILEEPYRDQSALEEAANPRYHYLGPLSHQETQDLLSRCQAMVISSLSEGGARVVGEAVSHHTPVIGTPVDGVIGLLEEDYPATFPVGDTQALAELLHRCETDNAFLTDLRHRTLEMAPAFHPDNERRAWARLLSLCQDLPSLNP